MRAEYQRLRDWLVEILGEPGLRLLPAAGAYYLMADMSAFGFGDDVTFARYLVREIGVATIPGSSFYVSPQDGSSLVRFCFSKRDETIEEAARRLEAAWRIIESGST